MDQKRINMQYRYVPLLLIAALALPCLGVCVYEKIPEVNEVDILSPASEDVLGFNFVFNLYQGSNTQDNFIIGMKPYLRDNDILVIVSGNGIDTGGLPAAQRPANIPLGSTWLSVTAKHNASNPNYRAVDTAEVNTRLAKHKAAFSGINIHYVVYTAGIGHLDEIISGLSAASLDQVDCIFSGYEPNYLLEFSYNGLDTSYIDQAAALIKGQGKLAGLAPSGRGFNSPQFLNWDYGIFAQKLDEMIVQTQTYLADDSRKGNLDIPNYRNAALSRLRPQLAKAPACKVYPQITISTQVYKHPDETTGNRNEAALIYCVKGIQAIRDAGFPGASLWFSNETESLNNMRTLVQTMRVAK
jgi:hypothetical protein